MSITSMDLRTNLREHLSERQAGVSIIESDKQFPHSDDNIQIFGLGGVTIVSKPDLVRSLNARNAIVENQSNIGVRYIYDLFKSHQQDFENLGLDDIKLIFFNSGDSKDSPFTAKERKKEETDPDTRYVAVKSAFNRRLRQVLAEEEGIVPGSASVLHDGHIMAYLLHEAGGHTFKFVRSSHTEEYEADRRAMQLMAELGYDPEYYVELIETLDLITHVPSPSHPSPKSRRAELTRTRAEILSNPKFAEKEWKGEVLPLEVEAALCNVHPMILEQRTRIQESSDDLQARMNTYSYRDFHDAWGEVKIQSQRESFDEAVGEYQAVQSGNFMMTKAVVIERALNLHLKYHEKKTHVQPDLRRGSAGFSSSMHYSSGMSAANKFSDNLDSREKTADYLEYAGQSYTDTFDQNDSPDQLIYTDAVLLQSRGMLVQLLGLPLDFDTDKMKNKSPKDLKEELDKVRAAVNTRAIGPLATFFESEIGKRFIEEVGAEKLWNHQRTIEKIREVYAQDFADAFEEGVDEDTYDVLFGFDLAFYDYMQSYLTKRGKTDDFNQFMMALHNSVIAGIEDNTIIDDEQLRIDMIAAVTELNMEMLTGQRQANLLPESIYNWGFPDSNSRFVEKINKESSEKAAQEGVLYRMLDVEEEYDATEKYRLHFAIGTAAALTRMPRFVKYEQGIHDEFLTHFISIADSKLAEYPFALLQAARGNWQEWDKVISEIEDEDELYEIFQALAGTSANVRDEIAPIYFGTGIRTFEDDYTATRGLRLVESIQERRDGFRYTVDTRGRKAILRKVILDNLPDFLQPENVDEWAVSDLIKLMSENVKNEEYEQVFEMVKSKKRFLRVLSEDNFSFVLRSYDQYQERLMAQEPIIIGELDDIGVQYMIKRHKDKYTSSGMNTSVQIPLLIERRLAMVANDLVEFNDIAPHLQEAFDTGWEDYEQHKDLFFDIMHRSLAKDVEALGRALRGEVKPQEEIDQDLSEKYLYLLSWEHNRGLIWRLMNENERLKQDGLVGYSHTERICEILSDVDKALALSKIMEYERYHEKLREIWGETGFAQVEKALWTGKGIEQAVSRFTPKMLSELAALSKRDTGYDQAKLLQKEFDEIEASEYTDKQRDELLFNYSVKFAEIALMHAPSHIRANPRPEDRTIVPMRMTEPGFTPSSMSHFVEFIHAYRLPIPALNGITPARYGFNYPRRVGSVETDILYGLSQMSDEEKLVAKKRLVELKAEGLFLGEAFGFNSQGGKLRQYDYADTLILILGLPKINDNVDNQDEVFFPEALARTFTSFDQNVWLMNDLARRQILFSAIRGDTDVISTAHSSIYERKGKKAEDLHQNIIKGYEEFCEYIEANGGFDEVIVDRLRNIVPGKSELVDELIAYAAMIYVKFAGKFTDENNVQKLEFMGHVIEGLDLRQVVGSTNFRPRNRNSGKPLHPDLLDKESDEYQDYMDWRVKGDSMTNEFYHYPHLRVIAYDSIAAEPWISASSAEGGNLEVSFIEQLVSIYLVAHEDPIIEAVDAGDYATAFNSLYEILENLGHAEMFDMPTGIIDRYKNWIVLRSLKDGVVETEDDLFELWRLFSGMHESNKKESVLPAMFLERYIELREEAHFEDEAQEGYYANIESATERILFFMPEGSYRRNEFIEKLVRLGSPTAVELERLDVMRVTRTGINKNDELVYSGRISLKEIIAGLSYDAKADMLIYFLDLEADKPDYELVKRAEKEAKADFSTVREAYWQSSELEKQQYVQRFIYGPDGFLSDEAFEQMKKDFGEEYALESRRKNSEKLVTTIMSRCEDHPSYSTYFRSAVATVMSLDPLDVSEVVAKISHRMSVHNNEALTLEDLVLITSRFFSSIGVKLVQFEVDNPMNTNIEYKQALSENKFNAGEVTPFTVARTFEREQESGYYQGYEITQYIRPLGKGGVNESYLVKMRFPDGEERLVAWKQVAEDVRHPDIVDQHLSKVSIAVAEIAKQTVNLNLAVEYLSVLRRAILKETDVEAVVRFQKRYRDFQLQQSNGFEVPWIGDSGVYSYIEEYVDGEVIAEIITKSPDVYNSRKRRRSLQRMVQDRKIGIVNDDPHDGNRILRDGKEVLIDYGMHSDYSEDIILREASWNICKGVLIRSDNLLRKGLESIGIDFDDEIDIAGNGMFEFLRKLTDVFKEEKDADKAGVVFDSLWWLYRFYAEYQKLSGIDKKRFSAWMFTM